MNIGQAVVQHRYNNLIFTGIVQRKENGCPYTNKACFLLFVSVQAVLRTAGWGSCALITSLTHVLEGKSYCG